MTMSRHGDIYVSESNHGAVFRLRQGSNELERLDVPGEFASPQTPALSADEKTLYVPDYIRGIAALDLSSRTVTWPKPVENIALNGIDGLYLYRDSFIAVQNGTNPPRLMRFSLDLQKQQEALAKERKSMVGSGDRSEKIRTYNFPQNRVTDHRIGLTIHQLPEIMDGKLQPIIDALGAHFQAAISYALYVADAARAPE